MPFAVDGTSFDLGWELSAMIPSFRLLIADDDDGLRESLRVLLEAQGYWVAAAGSGAEAIAVARAQLIDLAILDYRMGDTTGLDLIRQLRTLQPGTPSILMSAELEKTLLAQARIAGFAECLSKPLSIEVFRMTVANVLRRHPGGPIA